MKGLFGELIGTYILVLIGCGSVACAVLLYRMDLWQISLIWGAGVTLAIYASAPFSGAHLNPAVSIGFLIKGDLEKKDFLPYLLGQFIGAFAAAFTLYLTFKGYMPTKNLETAVMFGEYFPNPGNPNLDELSHGTAMLVEAGGTFLLMFGILWILSLKLKKGELFNPLLIGVLLSILIFFLAPFTQAGFNPARDFSPRLFSYLLGWKGAFEYNGIGWLTVYILSPIVGAILATVLAKKVLK